MIRCEDVPGCLDFDFEAAVEVEDVGDGVVVVAYAESGFNLTYSNVPEKDENASSSAKLGRSSVLRGAQERTATR